MKKIISLILSILAVASFITVPVSASVNGAEIWIPSLSMMDNRAYWGITVSDTFNKDENYIRQIIDDDMSSYWHSYYENQGSTITYREPCPHDIDITLPEETKIYGFSYTTRPDGTAGICTKYEAYVKVNGEWVLIARGDMDGNKGTKNVIFTANVPVKEFRFRITEGMGTYGSCADFNFFKEREGSPTVKAEEYLSYSEINGKVEIPKKDMKAYCENPHWNEWSVDKITDGTVAGFWQTKGTEEPVTLDVDLGANYTVSDIDITPRPTTDYHGTWTKFSIAVSLDGENYDLIATDLSLPRSLELKRVVLDDPAEARYVRFEITEHHAACASCGEITFYQSKDSEKEAEENRKEKYELKIGSNEIIVTKGKGEPKTVKMDVAPYIEGGFTLIPLRGLLEEMGATVSWEGETQKVTVKRNAMEIELQIWYDLVYVTGGRRFGRIRYTLNEPPRIVEGRTFIPLRFVSEHLGYNVGWDGATQTITITNY